MRKILSITLFVAVFILLSACSQNSQNVGNQGQEQTSPEKVKTNDPITLKIFTAQGHYNNDPNAFENEVARYVRKQFPYITLEQIKVGEGNRLPDLVLKGEIPDIVMHAPAAGLKDLGEMDLLQDLTDLIKSNQFDLSRLDNAVVQQGRIGDKLYGLPYLQNIFVLFYNKLVFDRFGVDYPKDGMTWDEVYDLARSMTREEAGEQYRGLSSFYAGIFNQYNQFSLGLLALDKDKAEVNTDGWKRNVENLARFYHIAGNEMAASGEPASFDIHKPGYVAMSAHTSEKYRQFDNVSGELLEWDMVSLPTFSELPGMGAQSNPFYYFLTNSSTHKEEAFKVIAYLLSEEVQVSNMREGIIPPYNYEINQKLKDHFGVDQPLLKDKNISAFFYNKTAAPPQERGAGTTFINPSDLNPFLNKAFEKVARGETDVNSALREAEELMNQKIEEMAIK